MLAQYIDISDDLLVNNIAYLEVSNYDYCLLQIVNCNNTTYDFFATNDSNAITGVSDGSIKSAINWLPVIAEDLSVGATYVTNTSGFDGMFLFNVVGRYIKISTNLSGVFSDFKCIAMLTKIS